MYKEPNYCGCLIDICVNVLEQASSVSYLATTNTGDISVFRWKSEIGEFMSLDLEIPSSDGQQDTGEQKVVLRLTDVWDEISGNHNTCFCACLWLLNEIRSRFLIMPKWEELTLCKLVPLWPLGLSCGK